MMVLLSLGCWRGHITRLHLLDSPPRADTRLYRPDSGYSDSRGSTRMSDRER